MFTIRLTPAPDDGRTTVLPVCGAEPLPGPGPAGELDAEAAALAAEPPALAAGGVRMLPRPLRRPSAVLLASVGDDPAAEAGWRAAGAAAARALPADRPVQVRLPAGAPPGAVRGLAEGLWYGGYHPRDRRTAEVTLAVAEPGRYAAALDTARHTARAVWLARDLTNAPASEKNPAWFAARVTAEAAARDGLTVDVRGPDRLAAEGFGGLLAVGGGSATPPHLVELCWRPPDATRHVVLVGKGITFDTGGISLKPPDAMKLMRKDMAGAAAVVGATLAAADLRLPVRITCLTPLAENALSGGAFRPGDVIRHYDGTTTETTNSDAEGRLVLADALGYAVAALAPDTVLDLATLTGANAVALGSRTAALYSPDDALAGELAAAADAAGERTWRMPLPADYVEYLDSDLADRHSSPVRGAGSVVAALFLRDFLGGYAGRWAHLDMSAPSWAAAADGELPPGATGWGVRTLLRWLAAPPTA